MQITRRDFLGATAAGGASVVAPALGALAATSGVAVPQFRFDGIVTFAQMPKALRDRDTHSSTDLHHAIRAKRYRTSEVTMEIARSFMFNRQSKP